MKNKKFKLNAEENYNNDILYEKDSIIIQYLLVVQHYIDHCISNTNNKNNSIFFTGLQMTTNVFRIMLVISFTKTSLFYKKRSSIRRPFFLSEYKNFCLYLSYLLLSCILSIYFLDIILSSLHLIKYL